MITARSAYTKAQVRWLALFISDIHLSPDLPHTTKAFFDFITNIAVHAESLYILGDLFEYWVGDDDLGSEFNQPVIDALFKLSKQTRLYWIAGNRDFLVSDDFFKACNITALNDPMSVVIGDKKLGLSHGDILCSDDHAYQNFRQQVRSSQWQKHFLSQPLQQRKAIANQLRLKSKMAQQNTAASIIDANQQTCIQVQRDLTAELLIHGHTHRPAIHHTDQELRVVLPDWDCDTEPPRGGWLSVTHEGLWELHQFQQQPQIVPL